jgi:hypothetical protein
LLNLVFNEFQFLIVGRLSRQLQGCLISTFLLETRCGIHPQRNRNAAISVAHEKMQRIEQLPPRVSHLPPLLKIISRRVHKHSEAAQLSARAQYYPLPIRPVEVERPKQHDELHEDKYEHKK